MVGHNLGVADEHYAELTQGEQPGETVDIIGAEIARFAAICLAVVTQLEASLLPHFSPPRTSPADDGATQTGATTQGLRE